MPTGFYKKTGLPLETPSRKGAKMSEESKKKIGLASKGNKYGLGHKHTEKWKEENAERHRGEKNHNWKGGITPEHRAIRTSGEYKLWRIAVFERDNYTCVWCGIKSSKNIKVILNADHIKPFSLFPELRFAIDNGRTLCTPCHRTTETYGGKSRRK